jgi:phosphate-selective porin OprO and OprP
MTKSNTTKTSPALLSALAALTLAAPAIAGSSASSGKDTLPTTPPPAEKSAYDHLWDALSIYKSDTGFINEFRIIGRYHGQYHWADGENGAEDDAWENRRMRAGIKVSMLDKTLTLNGEYQWLDLPAQFESEITDLWLEYKPKGDGLNFRVGKWQPGFGYEYGTSSREILTFERSAFVNSLGISYLPGVRIGGKHGNFTWSATGFSNDNNNEYFGEFDGGWSALVSLGYDAKSAFGIDKADFRLDYLHSDHDSIDNRLKGVDDAVSLNFQGKQGAVGFNSDVIVANTPAGDAFQLLLMPTYDITKKLQVVSRYVYANGSDTDTLSPLRRYESFVGAPKGDSYHSGYLGLNYYLYGHKLKVMGGVEYTSMSGGSSDADTLTFLTGVRLFF